MNKELKKLISSKSPSDIFIIGKGPSIDQIDLSMLKDSIVINVNDSEKIYKGDIGVFHDQWVADSLNHEYKCDLYFYNNNLQLNDNKNFIGLDYYPYTPSNANSIINRFFEDELCIEQPMVISALRIAHEIGRNLNEKPNVYLLGFDFTSKKGFSKNINQNLLFRDVEYQEKIISSQEHIYSLLLKEKDQLSINIYHIGEKSFSSYSASSFNNIYAGKLIDFNYKNNNQSKHKEFTTTITAEITTNHFGDMNRLKAMTIAAKQAGADFVKIQKRDVETFYSKEELDKPYSSPFGETFRDYRNGIELSHDDFKIFDQFCKKIGIKWFASVLDMHSYEFIKSFDPELIKLPSTISEHKDYLKFVADDFENDIVISTGYTDKSYEEFILNTFLDSKKVYLLQCTSSYPCSKYDTQISVIRHYYNLSKKNSNIVPGYSSHDIGSLCSMLAVSAGARMIEKHVKYGNVEWSHFDEVAVDLQNDDFKNFVRDIRDAELIVGEEEKKINSSEHHKYWLK